MKLSRKEMTILTFFLFFVVIAIGAFLFVLPEYEKIDPNKNALQAARDEKDRVYASLEREATIDQDIQYAIEHANSLSLYFYDDMTEYEADVIVREILDDTNMHTNSLSMGSFTTATLTVSDYIETVVSYPLKEYSGFKVDSISAGESGLEYDEDGKIVIPQAYIEKYGEEQALTEYLVALFSSESQTIGAITASFTVTGTRGDFLNFLNYVAGLERATRINSTTVSYTGVVSNNSVNNTPVPLAENVDADETTAEGEEEETAAPENTSSGEGQLNDNSVISAGISMTFYCVRPMEALETTAVEVEVEPETAE